MQGLTRAGGRSPQSSSRIEAKLSSGKPGRQVQSLIAYIVPSSFMTTSTPSPSSASFSLFDTINLSRFCSLCLILPFVTSGTGLERFDFFSGTDKEVVYGRISRIFEPCLRLLREHSDLQET